MTLTVFLELECCLHPSSAAEDQYMHRVNTHTASYTHMLILLNSQGFVHVVSVYFLWDNIVAR